MRREIQIKTNDSNTIYKKTIEATTLQDVANSFPEVNFENVRVVVRNPRKTITSLSTRLPDGDLFLFTFPEKNKSGTQTVT
jgi:hypothetical protein